MNTLIQKKHNHNKHWFAVKLSQKTQKFEIYFSNAGFFLIVLVDSWEILLEAILAFKKAVMLGSEGPQKLEFAYNVFCAHSSIRYTDLIEYKNIVETKTV